MTNKDRALHLPSLVSAIAIVAVAYAVNAVFNHTVWGLQLKAIEDLYVFTLFLTIGVILPAA